MAGELATVLRLCRVCRTEVGRFEVKRENMMLRAGAPVWCPACHAWQPEVREVEGRQAAIEEERRTLPEADAYGVGGQPRKLWGGADFRRTLHYPRRSGCCFVLLCVERPWAVEINAGARADAAHGYQPKRRRLRALLAAFQGIVQSLGDEGAHAEARRLSGPPHLLGSLVVQGNRRSHDALA